MESQMKVVSCSVCGFPERLGDDFDEDTLVVCGKCSHEFISDILNGLVRDYANRTRTQRGS